MSISKRKVIIISSIIFLCAFLVFSYAHFSSKNKIVLDEHSELLSLWVQDSSGNFQSANSFPGAGYILDMSRSKCENGGVLSGDGTGVTLRGNKTDKCYLYFLQPWVNTNTTRTLTCNNSAKTFDYKINGASFDVSTDADLTCTATKTANSTSQTFAAYLISLAGTTQGTGQMVNENGYRFEGKDPNNYIWFNNEMWRIIGVFDSASHGISNTNLVKIIRYQPIGQYSWDGGNLNKWGSSSLYRMLNGCYYNGLKENDITNISGSNVSCANYCLGYYLSNQLSANGNCDFSVMGLKKENETFSYNELIQEVTWYLGGPGKSGYTTYYPSNIYNYERNADAIYSGNPVSVNGNVGLMYYSDYGYSVLSSSCARGSYTMSSTYMNKICSGNSWIYGQGKEWLLTTSSSSNKNVIYLNYNGVGSSDSSYYGYNVRPVVYLKSNTYKLSGIGSQANPYVVGLSN